MKRPLALEGLPKMRPRTGKRGTDAALARLLDEALADLVIANCDFWACEGPQRYIPMQTCTKCCAVRSVMTVRESLRARRDEREAGGEDD